MDTDPKELENEDHKYVENVIMKPMELTSRPIRLHRIGVSTHERTLKERYRPLKVSHECSHESYMSNIMAYRQWLPLTHLKCK